MHQKPTLANRRSEVSELSAPGGNTYCTSPTSAALNKLPQLITQSSLGWTRHTASSPKERSHQFFSRPSSLVSCIWLWTASTNLCRLASIPQVDWCDLRRPSPKAAANSCQKRRTRLLRCWSCQNERNTGPCPTRRFHCSTPAWRTRARSCGSAARRTAPRSRSSAPDSPGLNVRSPVAVQGWSITEVSFFEIQRSLRNIKSCWCIKETILKR